MRYGFLALIILMPCILFANEQVSFPDPNPTIGELGTRLEQLDKRLAELEGKFEPVQAPKPKADQPEPPRNTPESSRSPNNDKAMNIFWDNGLQASTPNKDFRVHVGGRFHWDIGWVGAPENPNFLPAGTRSLNDGTAFRRARVRVDGQMYEFINWVMEYDFSDGVARLTDVYLDVTKQTILGTIRFGHFREPISIESLGSANILTFLEHASIRQAINPVRNPGIMVYNDAFNESVTWAIGGFRANASNLDGVDSIDGDYAATGRLTWNPIYANGGRTLLHLGGSYSFRDLTDKQTANVFQYAATPELRFGLPMVVDTNRLQGEHAQLFSAEVAAVLGPFSVQGEFLGSLVYNASSNRTSPGRSAFFYGWYLQSSYFLTGEFRPYRRSVAFFDKVRPKENFYNVKSTDGTDKNAIVGRGAWEVAIRYSSLHLDAVPKAGGVMDNLTIGLNWYWNLNSKLQWNYVLSQLDRSNSGGGKGLVHLFAMRVAIDF